MAATELTDGASVAAQGAQRTGRDLVVPVEAGAELQHDHRSPGRCRDRLVDFLGLSRAAAARQRFNELVDLLRDDLGVAPMFSWEELLEDPPRAPVTGLRA
ncbi:hypothetical protein [Streptomyces coeruleorubidus]|uniref:hypothetical protein n=1 Tax=Streptomyces coeruleorubidus TaxID=116188 RepID=UPI00364FC0F6